MKLSLLLEIGIRYMQSGRTASISGDIDAINRLARGNVSAAAHCLRLDTEKYKSLDRQVPDFDTNPSAWLAAMQELLTALKEKESDGALQTA